jgi:hypothetical protein
MDPVNPLDGLAAILRKRIASEATTKGKRAGQSAATNASAASQRPAPEVLKRKLQLSIESVALDDPARNKKVVRLFVESVLTWQFGESLLNAPGFAELADEVQATLESDEQFLGKLLASLPGGSIQSGKAIGK